MLLARRLFVKQNVCVITRLNSWKPGLQKQSDDVHSKLTAKLAPFSFLQAYKFFSKTQNAIPSFTRLPNLVSQTAFQTLSEKISQEKSMFDKLLSPPKLFKFQSKSYVSCIHDPASLKPDPITGMTPKMVSLLKCLAAAVRPDLHTHAVNIFKRVFETDRSIQRLFPKFPCDDCDALEQNPMFNRHVDSVLKSILNNMEQSGSVTDLTTNMALLRKIHENFGIPDKHFITFGNVINDYLKETLGAKYSEDVECAVAYFWRYICLQMTLKPSPRKCSQCGAMILGEAKPR